MSDDHLFESSKTKGFRVVYQKREARFSCVPEQRRLTFQRAITTRHAEWIGCGCELTFSPAPDKKTFRAKRKRSRQIDAEAISDSL